MIIEKERPKPKEIDENRSPRVQDEPPIASQIPKTDHDDETMQNGFIGGPQKRSGFKLVVWMWTAAIIDYLLILAGSLIALILFSMMVTSMGKSTELATSFAVTFLKSFLHPKQVNLTLLAMIISVGWTYFIVARAFMGASIGEKFCELRLGKPSERLAPIYIVRLIGRTSLVVATGVVLIPILSLIFRRDLAGKLSGGLYIYSLK